MLPPRAIVFDLDGTLLDTGADIAASCNHALQSSGRRPLRTEVVLRYVGDGARKLVARSAGLTEADDELDALVDAFVTHYYEHPVVHTTWKPHALELLDQLSDLPLAVCTNKPRPVTTRVLEILGVAKRFSAVVAGGDVQHGKPAPDPILRIAELLGQNPRQLIMIGDGPQDVLSARTAGARSIAVAAGYASEQVLIDAGPDIVLQSLSDANDIIRRWCESTVRVRVTPSKW